MGRAPGRICKGMGSVVEKDEGLEGLRKAGEG